MDGYKGLAKGNRSVARKLLDAVRDFLRQVKNLFNGNKAAQNTAVTRSYGVNMKELGEAARLWSEALDAAKKQTMVMGENKAAQAGGEARYSNNEQFSRDIQE